MYKVDVAGLVGSEYVPLLRDVSRTLVIQLTVQLLVSMSDGDADFFSPSFWLVLGYVVLGTLGYHLVFARLVDFE